MKTVLIMLNQGWIGTLVGVLGLAFAFISYKTAKVGNRVSYQVQALRLIGREYHALPNDVEILYKGEKVSRLSKAYVVLWNSGNTMIDGKNIISDDPLRFEIDKNGQILSANLIKQTGETIKVQLIINSCHKNSIQFDFDYLDPNDGYVLELLHTGASKYLKGKGTIKGVPKGLLDWGLVPLSDKNSISTHLPIIFKRGFIKNSLVIGGIIITIFGLLLFYYNILGQSSDDKMFGLSIVVIGLIYMFTAFLFKWRSRRRFPKELMIDDFS